MTVELVKDPSSRLAVAVNGWKFPASREWAVLADLFDAFVSANSKRKPRGGYERPWPDPSREVTKMGRQTRSQKDIRAALAARGH